MNPDPQFFAFSPDIFFEVTRVTSAHFESGNQVLQPLRPFQMPLVLTEE